MTIDLRPDSGGGTPTDAQRPSGMRLGSHRPDGTPPAAPDAGTDAPLPTATPSPSSGDDPGGLGRYRAAPMGINELQGLTDVLATLEATVQKTDVPTDGAGLVHDATQVTLDLETIASLTTHDGRPLSQRVTDGDADASALLTQAGYTVGLGGRVTGPDGQDLSPEAIDALGRRLLQQATSDYQQHKASYLSLRSQLEDHLDMPTRIALDDMEATMKRLESGRKGTTALHAVFDSFALTIAKGGKLAGGDIGFIATVATTGVVEATLTPAQRDLLATLLSRGGVIRRENGRLVLVGLSASDLDRIRHVHQVMTTPNSDAARQIAEALVEMVRAWGRAQAIARATGLSLQQALDSRRSEVGTKPPKADAVPDAPAAGGVQPDRPRAIGHQAPLGGPPERAAAEAASSPPDPDDRLNAEALSRHVAQVYEDQSQADHRHTDDQRQAALDRQTAQRLAADAEAATARRESPSPDA